MAIDAKWYDAQVAAFEKLRPDYVKMSRILQAILDGGLSALDIQGFVQVRAKAVPSFAEKILRKHYSDPIHQITDLCGGRAIVPTLEEIDRVSAFIRSRFDIHEDEDVFGRLGRDQFGYRSVHFIVSLRKADAGQDRHLAAHYTEAEAARLGIAPGPKYRAEIQVRTILQHGWALVAHDTLYKGGAVPSRFAREAHRIAAIIEDADDSFRRVLNDIEAYRADFGAYMDEATIKAEIETLRLVLAHNPDNLALARRISALAMTIDDKQLAQDILAPFQKNPKAAGSPDLNRDLGNVLIQKGNAKSLADGRRLLRKAVAAAPGDSRAWTHLAESCPGTAQGLKEALEYAEQAYLLSPDDPKLICQLLKFKIAWERSLDFIPLLAPSLDRAITLSLERAELKISLPWSYYDLGFCNLLLGRTYAGLAGYCLGIVRSVTPTVLDRVRGTLDDLVAALAGKAHDLGAALRLLDLAGKARGRQAAATRKPNPRGRNGFTAPVVIVAGGCDAQIQAKMEEYRSLLYAAFEGFRGTVISAGTTAGIGGLVGGLPGVKSKDIQLIGYLPDTLPRGDRVHPAYTIRRCSGDGYTVHGPMQTWEELLDSGVKPCEVKVLGINGGDLSGFEYQLAAALGARVGLVRGSGRKVSELMEDRHWGGTGRLLDLPRDPLTLREYLASMAGCSFEGKALEQMAQDVHERYRQEKLRQGVSQDKAMSVWESLPVDLQESTRGQVRHYEAKLSAAGLAVRPKPKDKVRLYKLSAAEIKVMAEMEHGRWNMERLASGWRLGPRDHDKRTTPYLVTWSELSPAVRRYDEEAVRNIPAILRQAGFEVYRPKKG